MIAGHCGTSSSQGTRPVSPVPLDPSDEAGIEKAARAFFLNVPSSPIGTLSAHQKSAHQKSTFFHLFFSVTPEIPEKATVTEDWKNCAADCVSRYIQKACAEGVLVQAFHGNILRLEVALRFSGQGRDGDSVRRYFKTVLKSISGVVGCTLKVESRILGQTEDARHAIYDNLRARTVPPLLGGWRMVLDRAPGAAAALCVSHRFCTVCRVLPHSRPRWRTIASGRSRRDSTVFRSLTASCDKWERGRVLNYCRGRPFCVLRLRRRGSTRTKVLGHLRIENRRM